MSITAGKIGLCLLFAIYNNFTDWRSYRISNRAVCWFGLGGLALNGLALGFPGILSSLAGGCLMLCLLPLFVLRMLGAGDIKELLAIGCMLGLGFAPKVLLYSILAAGGLAVLTLLWRGNAWQRLRYIYLYIKNCFLSGGVMPYTDELGKEESAVFRFSFGITGGLLILGLERLLPVLAG